MIKEANTTPMFSIVIPSTRSNLLTEAISSALSQDYDDFEIIVSYNNDDGGESVLSGFNTDKITCVRPESYMTVVDHWEFAFSHAKGDWVLMLADDDALLPNTLSIIQKAINDYPNIESIGWSFADYKNDDEGAVLSIPKFTGGISTHSADSMIDQLFSTGGGLEGKLKQQAPFFPLGAFSKEMLNRIRKNNSGELFQLPCPMNSMALFSMALSESVVSIDLPLTILGNPQDSAGGMAKNPETYYRMNAGLEMKFAPIKDVAIFPSMIFETIFRTGNILEDKVSDKVFNYERYFVKSYSYIMFLKNAGWDVSSMLRMFDAAMLEHSADFRECVWGKIRKANSFKNYVSNILSVRRILSTLRQYVFYVIKKSNLASETLRGRRSELLNIVEAAKFLGSKVNAVITIR